jgi:hypothetical protein
VIEDERRAKLERLSERLRLAFIEGAEEEARRGIGRPLTDEKLRSVMRRYPGDWLDQRPTLGADGR